MGRIMEFLVSLLPLLGVAMGWGFTQLTNYFNIRHSDKRILKETLYFLLELLYNISNLKSPNVIVDSIINNSQNPNNEPQQEPHQILPNALKNTIRAFTFPRTANKLLELKVSYENCLIKLSAVDPISAYRLKGMNETIEFLTQIENFPQKLINDGNSISKEELDQVSTVFQNVLEPTIVDKQMDVLFEVIELISKKLGRKFHNQLNELSIIRSITDQAKFKSEFSILLKSLVDQIQNSSSDKDK